MPLSKTGKSAYQIAVDNGFIGNEAAWLLSLKGANGERGLVISATEPPDPTEGLLWIDIS